MNKEQVGVTSNYLPYDVGSTNPLCYPSHTVIWVGDYHYKLPEGFPCVCGKMVVHYITCDKCGNCNWVLVERDQY